MLDLIAWKTRTARMVDYPNESGPATPWGPTQYAYEIARGVRWVGTASHGGLQVARGVAMKMLTPAARKLAIYQGGYYWYEEDVQYTIAFYEHPEWGEALKREAGGSSPGKEYYEKSIQQTFPRYFELGGLSDVLPLKPGMRLRVLKGYGPKIPEGSEVSVERVTSSVFVGLVKGVGMFRFRLGDYLNEDRFEVVD